MGNAIVVVESYFGLSIEIDLEKNTVKILKNGVLQRLYNKTVSEVMAILRELHVEKNEDQKAVVGWMISDMLDGEKLVF